MSNSPVSLTWAGEFTSKTSDTRSGHWAHHGIAVLPDGYIVTADPSGRNILVLDEAGECQHMIHAPIVQAHGITVEQSGSDTWLWIADNGDHLHKVSGGAKMNLPAANPAGQVIKMTLDGEILLRLGAPDLSDFLIGPFSPTHVVVDASQDGGTGNIWVCDGYGSAHVTAYDSEGNLLHVLDGTSGLGRFDQPHGAFIDRRFGRSELMVADRGNSRIQVFDLSGNYLRAIGVGAFRSPGHFAPYGTHVFVSELCKRIMIIDEVDYVHVALDNSDGSPDEFETPWPHALGPRGELVRPAVTQGALNSPHAIAVSGDRLLVCEWILEGRICTFLVSEHPA